MDTAAIVVPAPVGGHNLVWSHRTASPVTTHVNTKHSSGGPLDHLTVTYITMTEDSNQVRVFSQFIIHINKDSDSGRNTQVL